MKKLYMKLLKKCFGSKEDFFKNKIKECVDCQFQRKCSLEINKIYKDE